MSRKLALMFCASVVLTLALISGLLHAGDAEAQAGPVTIPQVVRVEGSRGGPVDVTGSSELGLLESTVDAIRAPLECTFGPTSRYSNPSNTLKQAQLYELDGGPYLGFSRWNGMKVTNLSQANVAVNCGVGPADAGTAPNCVTPGWGDPIYRQGDEVEYVVTELQEVWCIACGGSADLAVTVSLCVP